MSVSSVLNIAQSALFAQQAAVQTVAHNIANVDTPGYSRQEAVFEEAPPTPSSIGLMGDGVEVQQIKSYVDQALQNSISAKNSDLQEQTVNEQYFTSIQGVFNEDNSQLATTITTFFNDWQALSTDPTSTADKQTVASDGQNLSSVVKGMYSDLMNLQTQADGAVGNQVDAINNTTAQIASLNQLIGQSQTGTSQANDYIDQRNQLLQTLSGYMNVNYFTGNNNMVTVLTTNGKSLVDGADSSKLSTGQDPTTGFTTITWEDARGNNVDITDQVTGGSLGGLIGMRDNTIPSYVGNLNTLAQSVIDGVNQIHETGNNNAGIDFFQPVNDGNYAQEMSLGSQIKGASGSFNLNNIMVTTSTTETTANDVAIAIASCANQTQAGLGGGTFVDYASGVVAKVGEAVKSATDLVDYNQNAMTSLQGQQANVSGVSIDEEMSNLIKYQNAYQAAARLYTVANTLLQTLMQSVGATAG